MGEEERGEEKGNVPIPSCPRSPLPPGKRILSAPSSSSLLPLRKKDSRDLPDLSLCQKCGLRFPNEIQILNSQWRIVLLCKKCVATIRSAEVCAYCFSKISGEEGGSLRCRNCSRRIHYSCISMHRCYISPLQLDHVSFTCIDCCAIPKSRNSRVLLEDVVRDASSGAEKDVVEARAKENALRKAIVARQAAELARNALDAVLAASEPPDIDLAVPDEELALQLHRTINGSPRILRNPCRKSLGRLVELKKVRDSSDLVLNSSLDLDSTEKKEQKKEIAGHCKDINCIMPLTKCGGGGGEDSSELLQKMCGTPDRFFKKYYRRCKPKLESG